MSALTPASSTSLPERITNDLVNRILEEGELDPDEVAELRPLVPFENISYRPSDAALLCAIVPSALKSKVLASNDDKNASVRALFTAAHDLQHDDGGSTLGPVMVQIDCQHLRLYLVSRRRVDMLDVSFFVVPLSELSSPSLLEGAAYISQIYAGEHTSTGSGGDSDEEEFDAFPDYNYPNTPPPPSPPPPKPPSEASAAFVVYPPPPPPPPLPRPPRPPPRLQPPPLPYGTSSDSDGDSDTEEFDASNLHEVLVKNTRPADAPMAKAGSYYYSNTPLRPQRPLGVLKGALGKAPTRKKQKKKYTPSKVTGTDFQQFDASNLHEVFLKNTRPADAPSAKAGSYYRPQRPLDVLRGTLRKGPTRKKQKKKYTPSKVTGTDFQHPMLQFTSPGSPPSRDCRLCVSLGVTVGLFHSTTFQADGKGGFIVEEKSRLREDTPGATVGVGATVGLEPCADVTIEKQLPTTTYLRVAGAEHLKLVLEKMRYNRKVRWWFLSMLLTETLWVDAESKADSFLPSSVRRRKGTGLRLDDPIPAWFFNVVGGTVFSVGDNVFFKASSVTKIARKVEHIDDGGCLCIGDDETRVSSFDDGTIFWSLDALEIR